jgi:hypothetical protein
MSDALGARIFNVAEALSLGRFAPASVQRDYQWEERQCQDLFSDLERVFASEEAYSAPEHAESENPHAEHSEPETEDGAPDRESATASALIPHDALLETNPQRDYFLGAVVLRPVGLDNYDIYDGLQRLTSLTILIAVLRDLCGDEALADRLDTLIISPDGAFRVTLPSQDPTLREEVQKRGEAARARRATPSTDMGARVRGACTLFRREFGRWPIARRVAFAEFLLNRVQLVAISASDSLLASQIFVTTNARGLALDKVELFKGQLMDIAGDAETADRIASAWTEAQNLVGDDLEELLTVLDFVERREPQGAECLTQLADHLFRRYGAAQIGAWVERLELYASAWKDLHARLFNPNDADVGASIWMLRLFKWREWKPLALVWIAQFIRTGGEAGGERARQLFARRFDALHRRCLAITLTGNSALDRTKIFARAVGQVGNRRDPLDRQGALGFDAFAHGRIQETLRLPLVHDETRLTLVRWTEAMHWAQNPPRAIARASVEHILPQRPQANSRWLAEFVQEEARFNVAHAFGNLALADYKANEGMGNSDFEVKLPVLKAQSAKFKLLEDVVAEPVWNAERIAARSKKLCDFVWEAMHLPEPRTPRPA